VNRQDQQSWERYFQHFGEYPTELSIVLSNEHRSVTRGDTRELIPAQIIVDKVLIDVTDVCNFNTATGIQKVVRNLISHLRSQNRDFVLVAWAKNEKYLRMLSQDEQTVAYGEDLSLGQAPELGLRDPDEFTVLLPRNCLVFVPELAGQSGRIQRLSALATISNNSLVCMAYDAVPIVVPETSAPGMPGAFTFQSQIWHRSRQVIAISESTSNEVSALLSGNTQRNVPRPIVTTVSLPICPPSESISETAIWPDRVDPTILVVGTHEPRKNHPRILFAAEELWREGLRFHLTFIGSRGWKSEEFWEKFESLRQNGYEIEQFTGLSDSELSRAYSDATFLLFPSLHEGFGLPIAEAVSLGLPVVTSNVGSMNDLAREFELRTVDPCSILDMTAAIREGISGLLPTPKVAGKSSAYPGSWSTYAEVVWTQVNRITT
jgi:glycosyltransferase involved in cell wall biosynthesis